MNLTSLKAVFTGSKIPYNLSPRKIRCDAVYAETGLVGPRGQKQGTDFLECFYPPVSNAIDVKNVKRLTDAEDQIVIPDEDQDIDPVGDQDAIPVEMDFIPCLQLCLAYLVLDPNLCLKTEGLWDITQSEVYKCYRKEPIFEGENKDKVNATWLVQVVAFFKSHFKGNDGIFFNEYAKLDEEKRPSAWVGKLEQGTKKLGENWLGVYSESPVSFRCIK